MPATKLFKNQFSGAAGMYGQRDGNLVDVLTKVVQHQARTVMAAQNSVMTDNSTGVIGNALITPLIAVPVAGDTLGANDMAAKTTFDAAIVKHAAALAVFAQFLNGYATKLGLPLITDNTGGAVVTAGTVPAQDKVIAGAGAALVDFASAKARMTTLRMNYAHVHRMMNRMNTAVGSTVVKNNMGVESNGILTLAAMPATGAANAGAAGSTLSAAKATAFFTALAALDARVAAKVNSLVGVAQTAPPVVAWNK